MPTSKQRRQAAQRHLQRQLERRAEAARKRRRNVLVGAATLAVLVAAAAAAIIAGIGTSKPGATAAAAGTSSAGASAAATTAAAARTTNPDGTISCSYLPDTSGNPNLKDVGTPPNPQATPTQGTVVLKMSTNQGDLTLDLDRSKAPCAAASFAYLASKDFFANTKCHREVNEPTFGVLQCGDPTGTGSGGPSYRFGQEVTPQTTYPRGTIAMANTGQPDSTGSQFFLVFTDTQLPPDYTVVGTVDQAGLAVLDKIAAAGNDGSFNSSAGGGAPKLPVTIQDISVVSS